MKKKRAKRINNSEHTGYILGLVGQAFKVDFVPLYLQTQPRLTKKQAKSVLRGRKRSLPQNDSSKEKP